MKREAGITALLIDDHAVVLQGYRSLLEQAGVAVVGAVTDVGDALAVQRRLRPRVVVTDLAMPGVHGLEGIGRVLEADAWARVLVFTMHDDIVLAARALQAGATGYVTKTSPAEHLVEAVRQVADGATFLSPDIALKLAVHRLDGDDSTLQALSAREFDCFRLLAEGWDLQAVAARLNLSPGSAANLKSRLLRKLGVSSLAELVHLGVRRGVVRRNV